MGTITASNSLLLHLCFYFFCLSFGKAADTITFSTPINDPQALTSNNGVFRLGFFSLSNSTDRYVGIWYNNRGIPQESVLWVANRNNPLKGGSGVFMVSDDGNLVVSYGQNQVLWSSNVRNGATPNASARLLDTGNLVLKDNSTAATVWESFRHPSDVFMPTMRISTNVRNGEKVQLTSWKSSSDPSNGGFSFGMEPLNIPQAFIWNNSKPYWRTGPWNGHTFIGLPNLNSVVLDGVRIENDNEGTWYLTLALAGQPLFSYVNLDPLGNPTQRYWDDEKGNWTTYRSFLETECDIYGKCGAFGICESQKSSICTCLRGFEPNNIDEWNSGNWTDGCTRIKPLRCDLESGDDKDGFLKLERIKVPDFAEWSESDHLENECENLCLNNCSCIAYAYDAGIGCMSWSQDLIDIQKFSRGGINLYIRLPRSELEKKNITVIIIITVATGTTVLIAISLVFLLRWMAKKRAMKQKGEEIRVFQVHAKSPVRHMADENRKEVKLQQLPFFKFQELAAATMDFNLSNKLGEGGFGPVYKVKIEIDASSLNPSWTHFPP
ncbi:hypothetical protein V6N13_020175 [Hibiscus sabdariffa]|uniref:Uncharacterized protein n=1 Tax=Hibiscus sabdariffa TaxID=183260 RepID=A0ABR2EUK8_9ROSI